LSLPEAFDPPRFFSKGKKVLISQKALMPTWRHHEAGKETVTIGNPGLPLPLDGGAGVGVIRGRIEFLFFIPLALPSPARGEGKVLFS